MKRIIVILLIILSLIGNATVFSASIDYNVEKTDYSKVKDCAYNGSVYVLVGTSGLISVSPDLSNWVEVNNVCYTDIDSIIWDGLCFVFISNGNVFKSTDGYNWQKQACEFIAGSDFQYINGKYLVRQSTDKSPQGIMNAKVGFTTNFEDFEAICFDTALNQMKLTYTFSPTIYYMNHLFFAQGLMPNIIYSSDLENWSLLPELPNKNVSNKKQLLFTAVENMCLMYFNENGTIVCYTMDLSNLSNNSSWGKIELDVNAYSMVNMYHTEDYFYFFTSFDNAYRSTDGTAFEPIAFLTADGYFVENPYLPIKIKDNKCCSLLPNGNMIESGKIEQIDSFHTANKIWTGKEYITLNPETQEIIKTLDGETYAVTDIPLSNYQYIYTNNTKEMLWTGTFYLARVGGYEAPKMRGGALENGRTLFLFDSQFNLVNKHIFDGDVCDMSFCENKYYVKIGDLTDTSVYCVYSSDDMERWIPEPNLSEVPKTDGITVLNIEYDRDGGAGVSYTSKDIVKRTNIKTAATEYTEILYETYSTNKVYEFPEFYAAKMIQEDGIYIGFSENGVYYTKIKIPDDFMNLSAIVTSNTENMFYILGENLIYDDCGFRFRFRIEDIKNAIANELTTYVKVHDKILGFDTPPVMESDRTLVPLRFIFETLDADVDWENDSRTAVVKNEETSVKFSIDSKVATVNNAPKEMDVPARLIDSKTLVPLRFLSEELGFKVEWDEQNRTAIIQ